MAFKLALIIFLNYLIFPCLSISIFILIENKINNIFFKN